MKKDLKELPVTEQQKEVLAKLNPEWQKYEPSNYWHADCLIRLWQH